MPDKTCSPRRPISLNDHLNIMKNEREWATELELLAVQLLYNVNIILLKNTSDGFKNSFSLPVVFDMMSLPLNTDFDEFNKVYIYHHFYGGPWRIVNASGNHYMYLKPTLATKNINVMREEPMYLCHYQIKLPSQCLSQYLT